jgi:amino acid transporter
MKILTLFGLLFLGFILMLGGGPNHDRLGFRYWKSPGAMRPYIAAGATGRFLGVYRILSNAAFAYGGIEQLAVAAGETKNPTKSIPKAVRRVFWRICIFYMLGSFMVGIITPYDNPNLLTGSGISQSPWVIAIQNAGIPVLPSLINAMIITSASSAANAQLYSGSRYLYALAVHGQAPKMFLTTTKRGVPLYAVAMTASVALLTYMTVSSTGSQVFQWFSNLVAIAYLITWTAICFAYTRFRKAMDYNKIDPSTQHLIAPFRPYLAWFGLVFFSIVIIFNGFTVFTKGRWDIRTFITSYIGLP